MNQVQKNIDPVTEGAPLYCFTPARFKGFVQIFRRVIKIHGPSPVRIDNGRMAQPIGNKHFLVEMDLKNILIGEQASEDDALTMPASLDFIACEKHFKELSAITGKGAVEVYDQGDTLLFTDGHIEARLSKPFSPAPHLPTPIISDAQEFGEMVRDVEISGLNKYRGKSKYVSLLCYGEQLEQVAAPGKHPYTLHRASKGTLAGRQPDHVFTSQHFLALAGKLELSLTIYRNELGFWLKTSSRPGLINALTTYELLYQGKI